MTKKKPTYAQDWSAYDAAKTNEYVLFEELLAELLLVAVPEEPKGTGRPPCPRWLLIFAMCIKEYFKCDLRKTHSILKSLHQRHVIPKPPSYRSIDRAYNDLKNEFIFKGLIFISALPLAGVQEIGAIDSTGFSTTRYAQWREYKYAKTTKKRHIWRKLHAWTGTKTNIFLAAEITDQYVGDITMLPHVLRPYVRYFNMQEFVADKAYSGRAALEFLNGLGLTPFIPFRKNITLQSKTKGAPIWKMMLFEFHHRRDEFMDTYHARSNIETNFHMLKTRFGDSLSTRTLQANKNELSARVLCHNLCVLIQEIHELGITVDFAACAKTPFVPK